MPDSVRNDIVDIDAAYVAVVGGYSALSPAIDSVTPCGTNARSSAIGPRNGGSAFTPMFEMAPELPALPEG